MAPAVGSLSDFLVRAGQIVLPRPSVTVDPGPGSENDIILCSLFDSVSISPTGLRTRMTSYAPLCLQHPVQSLAPVGFPGMPVT